MIPVKVFVFIHIPKTAGTYLRTWWLPRNITIISGLMKEKTNRRLTIFRHQEKKKLQGTA